jgi:hypothetical protein
MLGTAIVVKIAATATILVFGFIVRFLWLSWQTKSSPVSFKLLGGFAAKV